MDTADWVNVVPILADDKGNDCFLMVRQYRQGSASITLEFPGGVIDAGEDPETAARRELLAKTANEFLDSLVSGQIPERKPSPPSILERDAEEIHAPGGITSIEEEDLLIACNEWVVEQGLPAP